MATIALGDRVPLTESEAARQLRRAVIAATVGTTIEWYDFFLYSIVTGLVFAKLYFPQSDPLTGTLQAFAIYAVGFIARPVGAAIFGHYGDRIGRKSTLIATLMLMGIATFAVAFVPTYETIGIWGAVILTLLRFIQGVGVGGEWGGSVLLAMEWTRSNKHRGFTASWPQFGVPAGLFLANLVVFISSEVSGSAFQSWGWRVPFALSIVLVAIGLYIRLRIMETPVFSRLVSENKIERAPLMEVMRRQPKEIVVSAFARLAEQAPFYIFTAFIFSYGSGTLHVSRDFLLTVVTLYWATQTITSSMRDYVDNRWLAAELGLTDVVTVPTAVAVFAHQFIDDGNPPREWAERLYSIRRWTPMPSGGHFPSAEQPDLLGRDITAFFNDLGQVGQPG